LGTQIFAAKKMSGARNGLAVASNLLSTQSNLMLASSLARFICSNL
jgi:Na+(H+)/acetate symporter ActP